MPTDATGPAPEVSAEGRRLIDGLRLASWEAGNRPFEQQPETIKGDLAAEKGAEDALLAYVAGLEAALTEIRDMDWVEACLDPQWARRRAHVALAAQRGRTTEGEGDQ